MTDTTRTRRPLQPMPDYVEWALEARGLLADYQARPSYQRNDYLDWIARAGTPETAQKRLEQMLAELERGGLYMGMNHPLSNQDGFQPD